MAVDPTLLGFGTGATILGGVLSAYGAQEQGKAQQLNIQGQIYSSIGQVFNLQTQAAQYGYQANIATYQAGVARMNAQVASSDADYALASGEVTGYEEGQKDMAARNHALVASAASGIDVNSASSAGVRKSITDISQYNQDIIRNSAAWSAYSYDVQEVTDEAQATVLDYTSAEDKAQQENTLQAANIAEQAIPLETQAYGLAGRAADINSIASLLGGGTSVANMWMKYGNPIG